MSRVKIEGNASGTGTFTIAAPNSSTDRTLTLPDEAGTVLTSASDIAASQLPAGSVIQVVSTTKTDTFSTTSSSFIDITGLSASITPTSASSKILVRFDLTYGTNGSRMTFWRISRDSTPIGIGDANGSNVQSTSSHYTGGTDGDHNQASVTGEYLDSPNTTSQITYKIQQQNQDAVVIYINRWASSDNNSITPRNASTITVMEIAG